MFSYVLMPSTFTNNPVFLCQFIALSGVIEGTVRPLNSANTLTLFEKSDYDMINLVLPVISVIKILFKILQLNRGYASSFVMC